MNYCTKCGNELTPNDKFCRKCGAKIDAIAEATPVAVDESNFTDSTDSINPENQKKENKFAVIAGGIICGCIVITAVSVFAIIGYSNSKNLKQGDEYFASKDYVSAAGCYAKVNKLSSKYSYSQDILNEINKSLDTYNQAKDALEQSNYSAALLIANKAVEDYPDIDGFKDIVTEASKEMAASITDLYNSGDYAESFKTIQALDQSLITSDIENIKNLIQGTIDGKINTAQSALSNKNYTSAETAANEALAIDPDNATAKSIIDTVSKSRSARETYIAKLKSTIQSVGCSYNIYDINKDGISDVVFRTQLDSTPGASSGTYALYVYEGGNFKNLGTVSGDGTNLYASKKNGVYVISVDPCWTEYIKYEYHNGSLVRNQNEEVFIGISTFSVDNKPASKQVAENNARIISNNAMTFTASSNLSAADSASFTS